MQTSEPDDWQVLDERIVDALISRLGDDALARFEDDQPTAAARAAELVDLAVRGKVPALTEKIPPFREWAEKYGLRRISNTLIELERVLALPARGQAILQAQTLTRFIALHAKNDEEALRRHLARD